MRRLTAATVVATVTVMACALADVTATAEQAKPSPAVPTEGSSDAKTAAAFSERLRQYTELHNNLEKKLPPLPTESNPQAIDTHQRTLERLLKQARASAKQGDFFDPATARLIRRLLAQVLSGSDGAQLKATIMDENPTLEIGRA